MGLFDKFFNNDKGSKAFENSTDDEKIRKQAEKDRKRKEQREREEREEEERREKERKRQEQKKDDLFPWDFVNKKDDNNNNGGGGFGW
jgi:hypothetical protein